MVARRRGTPSFPIQIRPSSCNATQTPASAARLTTASISSTALTDRRSPAGSRIIHFWATTTGSSLQRTLTSPKGATLFGKGLLGQVRASLVHKFYVYVYSMLTRSATSGTFPDGNQVSWSIVANAGSLPTYSHVGTAKNSFESWNVYKDNYRVLYQVNGWTCYTVYWCF